MHKNLKFTKGTTKYSIIQVTAHSQLKNFISICKLEYIRSAVCIIVRIEKQAHIWYLTRTYDTNLAIYRHGEQQNFTIGTIKRKLRDAIPMGIGNSDSRDSSFRSTGGGRG